MTEPRVEMRIAADHPSLPGHFPGKPVVPGVVLLECVIAAARERYAGIRITGVANTKFLQPLLPEQAFEILLERGETLLKFRCLSAGAVLAQGSLSLA